MIRRLRQRHRHLHLLFALCVVTAAPPVAVALLALEACDTSPLLPEDAALNH